MNLPLALANARPGQRRQLWPTRSPTRWVCACGTFRLRGTGSGARWSETAAAASTRLEESRGLAVNPAAQRPGTDSGLTPHAPAGTAESQVGGRARLVSIPVMGRLR